MVAYAVCQAADNLHHESLRSFIASKAASRILPTDTCSSPSAGPRARTGRSRRTTSLLIALSREVGAASGTHLRCADLVTVWRWRAERVPGGALETRLPRDAGTAAPAMVLSEAEQDWQPRSPPAGESHDAVLDYASWVMRAHLPSALPDGIRAGAGRERGRQLRKRRGQLRRLGARCAGPCAIRATTTFVWPARARAYQRRCELLDAHVARLAGR